MMIRPDNFPINDPKILDGFLEIVYHSQFNESGKGKKMEDSFNPLMEELKKRLDEETYLKVEKMFCDCYIDCTQYCAIESMKLAIGIMSGTYVPFI